MRHNLHGGYQRYSRRGGTAAQLERLGLDHRAGRRTSFQGTPIFYLAAFQQQGFGTAPPLINSEYRSQSIEVNDTINWKNWTFNVGLLASNDTLYGQGLNNDASARCPGSSGRPRSTSRRAAT